MELNRFIDHTVLKATTSVEEIKKLCSEAKEFNFYSVCVNGCYVPLAKQELENSKVKIAAVIGFPLGAMTKEAKIFEAKECIANGASEIDMVINVGFVKSGMMTEVEEEIRAIKEAIGNNVLKVIFETCYLTDDEKIAVAKACVNAKADFVKTSTGFGTGGATYEDVKLMKETVGDEVKVKAAGGIRDLETCLAMIEAGAERIGCSKSIEITEAYKKQLNK